jgi:hypothetical protein
MVTKNSGESACGFKKIERKKDGGYGLNPKRKEVSTL